MLQGCQFTGIGNTVLNNELSEDTGIGFQELLVETVVTRKYRRDISIHVTSK